LPADWSRRFFILTLSFLLLNPPLGAAEETAQVHFFHALKARQEGRLLKAEQLFRKAVEIEPENPDFRFELGNLYILRNKPESARLEFEQATMAAPTHIPAHYNLGLVYRELELTSEARNEFKRVLEIDPKNLKAQLQIGYTYAQEGFTDEAGDAFQKAKRIDPTSPEPEEALRDLGRLESEARRKSQSDLSRRFWQNQRSLYQGGEPEETTALSSQTALAQAGSALVQQFFARRADAEKE